VIHTSPASSVISIPKQRFTFNLVQKRRHNGRGRIMARTRVNEMVKQTAWNNRLSSLANLGQWSDLKCPVNFPKSAD
jgi:hypothetical protein